MRLNTKNSNIADAVDGDVFSHFRPNPDWANLPLFDRKGLKRVRFGDVVENVNATERNPAECGLERFIGLEHIEPGSLHIRSWGNVSDGTTFTRRCRPGQVLFGKRRAYQRKVAISEFDAVVSGDIYVLAPKNDRLLSDLLPFLCMSERFFQHAVGTSAGSLSPRTNWSSLASFEFDLPPLDHQRRIAEILWAVDDHLEFGQLQVTALSDYQKAVWFNHALSEDIKMVPVGQVADVANGSTPSKTEERFWNDGTVPWLPTGKVHDRYIQFADEFITEFAVNTKKARIFPKGSVLVAMIGQGKTRGTVALLEIDSSINQNFACIIPRQIDSYYLFYALDFSYEKLRRSSHGSNQEALNCGLVSNFPVPLPNSAIQRIVGTRLRKLDEIRVILRNHLNQQRLLLDELINVFFV